MENEKRDVETLTLKDFIILVKEMRFNQRRFRKSSKEVIKETLEPIETEVDDLIARYLDRQTKLF